MKLHNAHKAIRQYNKLKRGGETPRLYCYLDNGDVKAAVSEPCDGRHFIRADLAYTLVKGCRCELTARRLIQWTKNNFEYIRLMEFIG